MKTVARFVSIEIFLSLSAVLFVKHTKDLLKDLLQVSPHNIMQLIQN